MRMCFSVLILVLGAGNCSSGNTQKQLMDAGPSDSAMGGADMKADGFAENIVGDATNGPDIPRANTQKDAGLTHDTSVEGGRDLTADLAGDTVANTGVSHDGTVEAGRADVSMSDSSAAGGHLSVLQHHNSASRDGFFIDPILSRNAVANLHMDPNFAGAKIKGPTYAQPLYLAGSGSTPDLVIVATEQNHVYAFNASTGGLPVWDQSLGIPLPKSRLATLRQGCGNIDPLGVTGTPIIDAATRTIYLDAMSIASTDAPAQHKVFALDADTGSVKPGWPVDLNSKAAFDSTTFDSLAENQRGALAFLDGQVFIPFGGHIGDCGNYHGWIIGIVTTDPTRVSAWATRAIAGGVWAPGGISSDGQSLFFATGNTEAQVNDFTAPRTWQDGETIFRMPPSLVFSGQDADRFTPSNWTALDDADTDLGGTTPIVFNLPGAMPSALVIGLGKDGNAYLLDKSNLGGISNPLVLASVAAGNIINAAAAYTTPQGSYVVFKATGKNCPSGQSGGLTAIKITVAAPPTVSVAWCGGPATQDSPAVSATDAQGNDAVVWIVNSDSKLYALRGCPTVKPGEKLRLLGG
jgi:hypothetical protein